MTTSADFPNGIDLMLLSVPYSGTRFLQDLLNPTFNLHTHPSTPLVKIRAMLSISRNIVCPLRNPESVWKSWCSRNVGAEQFWQSWCRLEYLAQEFPIFFLPIDVPQREKELDWLSAQLDRKLSTDWSPVGNDDPKPGTIQPQELTYLYDLPFMSRWYEKPAKKIDTRGDQWADDEIESFIAEDHPAVVIFNGIEL